MELKFPVVVLGVNPYDFVNDNGERLMGTSVHYFSKDTQTGSFKGHKPEKTSIEAAEYPKMEGWKFPVLAECHYSINPNNRKNPMKITEFKVIKELVM